MFYLAGVFAFLGVMMFVTMIVCEKSAKKNYILYDEGGIELHTAKETKRVPWDQIGSVQVQGNAFLILDNNSQWFFKSCSARYRFTIAHSSCLRTMARLPGMELP